MVKSQELESRKAATNKDKSKQTTPPEKITKGMASPAPTVLSPTTPAETPKVPNPRRALFKEDGKTKEASKKGKETSPPEQPKEPTRLEQQLQQRNNGGKSKRDEQDNANKNKPTAAKAAAKPQAKANPAANIAPEPKKKAAKPNPPAETPSGATEKPKVETKKSESSASLGPAVREALNRASTGEIGDTKVTQADTEGSSAHKGGKKEEEEEEVDLKAIKQKRDLVTHARRMRFYRSLSSLWLGTLLSDMMIFWYLVSLR